MRTTKQLKYCIQHTFSANTLGTTARARKSQHEHKTYRIAFTWGGYALQKESRADMVSSCRGVDASGPSSDDVFYELIGMIAELAYVR